MRKHVQIAATLNLVANIFLFGIKIFIGIMFSSISLIGDALNSLSDTIAAIFIFFTVKINNKDADDTHQFGHSRAENISGYTTGILMLILGISVLEIAIEKIITKDVISYNVSMLVVVFVTLFVKLGLYFYVNFVINKENSPALKANLQDHFNDIIIILGVLVAVIGIRYGYYLADPIMGIVIGVFIFKGGYYICKENVGFLMGVPAEEKIIRKIREKAYCVQEVKKINLIKTQYLGNKVQVEIHVAFDSRMVLDRVHELGNKIRDNIKSLNEVNSCFVHIDPYVKK